MSATLRPAEQFRDAAGRILSEQRDRLAALGIDGELVLVGGSSVVGAVTKGDVDLHLRVPAPEFDRVVALLGGSATVVHPEIWSDSLATFEVEAELPTGIAVTPVGSEHDLRFSRCWQLLAADPALVAEYNRVKLAADAELYEQRKSEFFDRLLQLWPSHRAGGGAG